MKKTLRIFSIRTCILLLIFVKPLFGLPLYNLNQQPLNKQSEEALLLLKREKLKERINNGNDSSKVQLSRLAKYFPSTLFIRDNSQDSSSKNISSDGKLKTIEDFYGKSIEKIKFAWEKKDEDNEEDISYIKDDTKIFFLEDFLEESGVKELTRLWFKELIPQKNFPFFDECMAVLWTELNLKFVNEKYLESQHLNDKKKQEEILIKTAISIFASTKNLLIMNIELDSSYSTHLDYLFFLSELFNFYNSNDQYIYNKYRDESISALTPLIIEISKKVEISECDNFANNLTIKTYTLCHLKDYSDTLKKSFESDELYTTFRNCFPANDFHSMNVILRLA